MKVFHRTASAKAILANGFQDSIGHYLTETEWRGVWFSDRPLDCNEGASGDVLFTLEMPESVFQEYEWVQEPPGPYREALIPADVANTYGPPTIHDESLGSL
jgi:hypothetical protein